MKVFIATFISENYGTLLQAYALQNKLKELGTTPVLVEFPGQTPNKKKNNIIKRIRVFFRPEKHYNFIHKIRRKLEYIFFIKKREKIAQFISDNLIIQSYDDCITQIRNENCILLAGSDQIWNILNNPINDFYLFNYVKTNCRRCSYAASIGLSELDENQKKYYAKVLKNFYSISFREKRAYDLLNDYLDNPIVRYDIDPTLLYEKNFWMRLVDNRIENEPYVFVYILRPDRRIVKMARIVAKEKRCKIIFLGQYNNIYLGCRTLFSAGVKDFLSAIAYAEMVITNSFHCTAFSVLFEKKFVSVEIESTSSRVENLLSMVGLQNHIINDMDALDVIYDEYDTKQVSDILREERNRSLDYLRKIINIST